MEKIQENTDLLDIIGLAHQVLNPTELTQPKLMLSEDESTLPDLDFANVAEDTLEENEMKNFFNSLVQAKETTISNSLIEKRNKKKNNSEYESEEKKEKKRERNRIAARRSRYKKHKMIENLEKQIEELKRRNTLYNDTYYKLKAESQGLFEKIKFHKQKGCEL